MLVDNGITNHLPALLIVGAVVLGLLFTLAALVVMRAKNRRARTAHVDTPLTVAAVLKQPEPSPAIDHAALSEALREAKASGRHERAAGLQLSLARSSLDKGDAKTAAELLRDCIRSSSLAGVKDTHARARVELGDIDHASGDLSSACEHWQIARSLFHDLRLSVEHKAVEDRMLRNGCPTDWVLTDF